MTDIYYAAMQNKDELDGLLDVCRDIGAKKALEIGTCGGGTAAALATIVPEVVTVDIVDSSGEGGWPWERKEYKENYPNAKVRFSKGDSRTFYVAGNVRLFNDEKYDLVFIDGEHTDLTGYMDWKIYAQMGKVVAIHDIHKYKEIFDEDWFPRTFWRIVKTHNFKTREFADHETGGIGVIWMEPGVYDVLTKEFEVYLLKKLTPHET